MRARFASWLVWVVGGPGRFDHARYNRERHKRGGRLALWLLRRFWSDVLANCRIHLRRDPGPDGEAQAILIALAVVGRREPTRKTTAAVVTASYLASYLANRR